jgi:hypothetical protein
MGVRAKLAGHGHDPERRHPNYHNRREGDRQGSSIAMIDKALIVEA